MFVANVACTSWEILIRITEGFFNEIHREGSMINLVVSLEHVTSVVHGWAMCFRYRPHGLHMTIV